MPTTSYYSLLLDLNFLNELKHDTGPTCLIGFLLSATHAQPPWKISIGNFMFNAMQESC